jgi:tetratricopeptide (TPR) repeat protein
MRRAATMIAAVGWVLLLGAWAGANDEAAAISADLTGIYARTQSASVEADFTDIARACSKVMPDKTRSQADRDYATRLFAWALNRRGEVRSEAAAQLVRQGVLEDARQLDTLAGQDFATAVQFAPENWRMQHNLAVSLAMQGRLEDAIAGFTKVIQLKQDYPNAFYNRAELYFESEQFARAIGDYSVAIELAPSDAQYYNGRAHARFMLERHAEALADYRRAVELDPNSPVIVTDLADALQFLGQWEDAANRYRQAIASDKSYARAYRNVAWLLSTCPEQRFRNPELALSAARRAADLEGGRDYRTLDTLAAATAASGNAKEAAEIMKRAVQAAPGPQRGELQARMAIYKRGEAYVQPSTASPMIDVPRVESEVRTASTR